jgi:hypothetical protein
METNFIFYKFDHTCMFFRLRTCFSDNLIEFHSRNKKSVSNNKNMNSN